jgi:hypothetical protein
MSAAASEDEDDEELKEDHERLGKSRSAVDTEDLERTLQAMSGESGTNPSLEEVLEHLLAQGPGYLIPSDRVDTTPEQAMSTKSLELRHAGAMGLGLFAKTDLEPGRLEVVFGDLKILKKKDVAKEIKRQQSNSVYPLVDGTDCTSTFLEDDEVAVIVPANTCVGRYFNSPEGTDFEAKVHVVSSVDVESLLQTHEYTNVPRVMNATEWGNLAAIEINLVKPAKKGEQLFLDYKVARGRMLHAVLRPLKVLCVSSFWR